MGNLSKSKERVRKHAEVFTPIHIVREMIDLIEQEDNGEDPWAIGKTWLEPSCGNGVFVGEIVRRKLEHCLDIYSGIAAMRDVYAIDIQADNVEQAKCQAMGQFVRWACRNGYFVTSDDLFPVNEALYRNFVIGDFLKPETIKLYDWELNKYVTLKEG